MHTLVKNFDLKYFETHTNTTGMVVHFLYFGRELTHLYLLSIGKLVCYLFIEQKRSISLNAYTNIHCVGFECIDRKIDSRINVNLPTNENSI